MANKIAAKKTRRLFGKKGPKADRLDNQYGVIIDPSKKTKKRMTDFGERFKAKQDCKKIYGLTEKAFEKYFQLAQKSSSNTEDMLLILVERRLDNTVFASGFFPTRAMARQVVSHGKVFVNGRKLDIPSAQVKMGDVVTMKISDKMKSKIEENMKIKKQELKSMDHVYFEPSKMEIKVLRDADVTPMKEFVETRLIVEYYSR